MAKGTKNKRKAWIKKKFMRYGKCFYCKIPVEWEHITIDHYEPKYIKKQLGINYNHKNRLFCCKDCNNNLKQGRTIYEFRNNVTSQLADLMRNPFFYSKDHSYHINRKFTRYKNIINTTTMILKSEKLDFLF